MPMKMKNFITKDLLCSSSSSTAICSSTDQRSMVRNGLKPLHHLDSKLNNHYTSFTTNKIPCISELPFTPRPSHRLKTQKLGSNNIHDNSVPRRKSSADVSDLRQHKYKYKYKYTNSVLTGYSSPTPAGHSSRYLLGDSERCLELVTGSEVIRSPEKELRKSRSEKGRVGSLMDTHFDKEKKSLVMVNNDGDYQRVIKSKYGDYGERQKSMGQCKDSDSRGVKLSSNARARDQVVVLRVSLNCKCRGCESKLRKHLSKMQGVTSFSIDLEIKKVTVVGNVSPLDVLTSISKVKNAQFWSSPTSTSSTTSSLSTSSTLDLSY